MTPQNSPCPSPAQDDRTTDDAPRVPRRTVLLSGLAVAGGAGLAGCGASSGTSPSTSSQAAAADVVIVKLADVPVGGSVAATLAGKKIIVSQPAKREVVAFSAICTHQGCPVAPKGARLDCPCHGSSFDAFTGKNLFGPAPRPLAKVPVKLSPAGDTVVSA